MTHNGINGILYPKETIELISKFKINDKVFDYYRKSVEIKKETKPVHKYICEGCNLKISHYKEIQVKCVACDKEMVERS